MAFYYIDYENVHSAGLEGVEHLTKKDMVYVLYNEHIQPKLSLDILERIEESAATVEYFPAVCGGKQALDFQLVALMFQNMKRGQEYHIVSNDKGFMAVFKMAQKCGATIELIKAIKDDPDIAIEEIPPEKKWENINALFGQDTNRSYFVNASRLLKAGKTGRRVANVIYQSTNSVPTPEAVNLIVLGLRSTNSKDEFYRYCQKSFGNQVGTELYRIIRPIYLKLVNISYGGDCDWKTKWFLPLPLGNANVLLDSRKSI